VRRRFAILSVVPENVEPFLRLSDAFNRRDIEELCEFLDPDVEWIPIMAVLEGRVYRGHEGVRQWVEDLAADWEYFETHQEHFRQIGDRVLVFGRWRARARTSGVELDSEQATWLMDMQDGKVVRLQTFTDRKEALKAAGVSKDELA
jgi:ketosteroid isomerase-like protein